MGREPRSGVEAHGAPSSRPLNAASAAAAHGVALAGLGLTRGEAMFLELVPAVAMAWADGVLHPAERVVLQAYAHELAARVNAEGGPRVSPVRGLRVLGRLMACAPTPAQQALALCALVGHVSASPAGRATRARILCWAEAVCAADGESSPEELAWLRRLEGALGAG